MRGMMRRGVKMTDVLGAVNDFILAYVWKKDSLPALAQNQIVRGWQNAVSALPADIQEYVVITLLSSERHGTNVHQYIPTKDDGLLNSVSRMAEHMVQADFCCAYPQAGEETARQRAEILEMLTRDRIATVFYEQHGFSACYAEGLRPMPFQNEAEQWVARYSVTLHLSGWTSAEVPIDFFSNVNLYLENVDVHHPVPNKTEGE